MTEAASSCSTEIETEEIHKLLEHFAKSTHKVRDGDVKGDCILEKCFLLFAKDYNYSVVTNFNGELCSHYPSKLVILEYEKAKQNSHEEVQSIYDVNKLRDLFKQARFARCRARFVVPVILYEGKHICRSATLSGGAEIYGRSGIDFFFSGGESIPGGDNHDEQSEWQLFDRFRGQDIRLQQYLNVGYICDLMVEKKKVKFGMNVTSSEKVDKENRYSEFSILSLPYPGCEFFRDWRDNCYTAESLQFNWAQPYVDAHLDIPTIPSLSRLAIDWSSYKNWDLVHLTQNYFKVMLQLVREGDNGVLVHCISGWDRTPLFISLLRLSLWADGAIHTSLSPVEILYLTIAYDWYCFGHNLSDRLTKGEEIFFFCFSFLRYITTDDFSIRPKSSRTTSRSDSESNMEGVLLDTDACRLGVRGSNTSINSASSSSVDNAPIYFNTGAADDDTFNGDTPTTVASSLHFNHRQSAVHFSHRPDSPRTIINSSTTSPMAVPQAMRRCSETTKINTSQGSWQIISSCGSLRGYGSSASPHSNSDSSHNSSCQEASELLLHETSRYRRLDAVRRIFHNAYTNTITLRYVPESGASFLNQFAEKVGIRPGRNTVV